MSACNSVDSNKTEQKEAVNTEIAVSEVQIEIPIEGMSCMMCVKKIEEGLKSEKGIQSVQVNLEKNNAILYYNPEETASSEITEKIEKLGYKPGSVNTL